MPDDARSHRQVRAVLVGRGDLELQRSRFVPLALDHVGEVLEAQEPDGGAESGYRPLIRRPFLATGHFVGCRVSRGNEKGGGGGYGDPLPLGMSMSTGFRPPTLGTLVIVARTSGRSGKRAGEGSSGVSHPRLGWFLRFTKEWYLQSVQHNNSRMSQAGNCSLLVSARVRGIWRLGGKRHRRVFRVGGPPDYCPHPPCTFRADPLVRCRPSY